MKKKIITLCLVVALAATAIIGGTLAYFTDTDDATNVMTMGNVKIDLTEEERVTNENGYTTELKAFEQYQTLLPIIEYPQSADRTTIPADTEKGTEAYGMPKAENWIDKVVNVDNTGNQDAYVRVVFAFPAAFDDVADAANMMVHWNGAKEEQGKYWQTGDLKGTVTMDGTVYNIYTYTYKNILKPGKTTAMPAITGLYMDKEVDAVVNEDNTVTYSMHKEGYTAKSATVAQDYQFKLYVYAQGVQAEGFTDAETALNAAFGAITADNNPWKK